MEQIKVIIAEKDEKQRSVLKNELEKYGAFHIVGETGDGRETLQLAAQHQPDLLLCNMILRSFDALAVLEQLHGQCERMPKVIVTSFIDQESMIAKAYACGADDYMIKPVDMGLLLRRISQLLDCPEMLEQRGQTAPAGSAENEAVTVEERLRQMISALFLKVGLPAHLLGFRFAQEAVEMLVVDPSLMKNRTKVLYPAIAARHDTSGFCVERAIRHVITLTWERGIAARYEKEYGQSSRFRLPLDRPTSGEFIALVAEYIRPRHRSMTEHRDGEH